MASSDIGGLGAKEGPALAYTWTLPSIMPDVLPWVLLLLLLALKPNRAFSAWLIWLPLGGIIGLAYLLEAADLMNSNLTDPFQQVFGNLVFALAAVWLVSPFLVRKFRLLTGLGLILSLGIFSAVFYAIRQLWDNDWSVVEGAVIISLFVLGFGVSLALVLSSLMCRRRFRPMRFSIWLVIWLLLGISACASPFFLFFALTNGFGGPPLEMLLEMFTSVLIAVGGNALITLPFLLLSFSNGFYRERFKALFHLTAPTAPPVAPPPILTEAGTEGT